MYPALLLLIFGILLGVSNLIGLLEPRGGFAFAMAWGATVTAPFGIYEVFKPFWKSAAVIGPSGVHWAKTNHVETGFVPRQDIADVSLERVRGVVTMTLLLGSEAILQVPIRIGSPIDETLLGIRTALAFRAP